MAQNGLYCSRPGARDTRSSVIAQTPAKAGPATDRRHTSTSPRRYLIRTDARFVAAAGMV